MLNSGTESSVLYACIIAFLKYYVLCYSVTYLTNLIAVKLFTVLDELRHQIERRDLTSRYGAVETWLSLQIPHLMSMLLVPLEIACSSKCFPACRTNVMLSLKVIMPEIRLQLSYVPLFVPGFPMPAQ